MKKKNLEKAIILGLMAASISVPVWAADVSIENFKNSADGSNVITVNEEKTVIGTGVYGTDLGSGLTENTFWKDTNTFYTINVGNTASLTLQNVNTYGPYITGNGNIEINISDPQSPAGLIAGIAVSGYIQGNSLIINATNEDGKDIKGINTGGSNAYTVNNHDVTVDVADSVRINSQSDGIFTAQDTEADVNITAGKGILIDAETRNGIYNAGNVIESDKVNNINLTSDSGDIIIFSNSNDETSAGVKSKNFGAISLTSNQGNIVIGQQDAKGKYTTVNSNTNGIYAAAGNVTLNAGMDNLIYATTTGTYATGAGTVVTLSAENNGIYVNNNSGEPGGIAKGIYVSNGATKKIVSKGNTTITSEGNVRDIIGIHADAGGTVDIDAVSLNIKATANDANVDNYLSGILAGDINQNVDTDNATVIADVDGDIHVDIYSAGTDSYGIKTNKNGNVDLTSHEGNITINALDNVEAYTGATKYGIHTGLGGQTTLVAEKGSISVNAGDSETYRGNNHGITNYGEMLIDAKESVSIKSYSYGDSSGYSSGIDAKYGITTINAGGNFVLDSISNIDIANSKNYGAQLSGQGKIDIDAANVTIKSKGDISTAIYEWGSSTLNIDSHIGDIDIKAEAGTGKAQAVYVHTSSAELNSKNDIILIAQNNNDNAQAIGIYSNKSNVDLTGENSIYISTSKNDKLSSGHVIKAENSSVVNLNATAGDNVLAGVIYAKDNGTNVTLDHNIIDENGNAIKKGSGSNIIRSSAHGSEAEGRNHMVAALYAQNNGTIDIKAGEDGVNYIATDFSFEHADDSEHTIWAQQGGKINIEGTTVILASNADKYTDDVAGKARGIAVTAGTGDTDFSNITDFNIDDAERSTVKINYLDGTDKDGNTAKSSITGDIVSGYGGLINIQALDSLSKANSTSGLIVKGNALAANGGKLNLDIGNGGVWTGRADDYGDAGVVKDGQHTSFFNPAFSNEIVQGGQVNLIMGEGSRWNVTGQSWITSIKTGESDVTAGTPIIDLVNANTDRNTTAHALTVYELDGNAIFNMNLDGDRDVSDMLYIKNAEGEYVINVVDSVSVDDMYQDGFDGLRFATIGDGSNVSFRAITYNKGINNVEYEVGQDAYDGNEENNAYNSSETDGGMSSEKPGSDMVDDFFDSTGTPENPQGPDDTEIMTLENTIESDSNVNGTTNFKLIGVKDSEISDGGKTVVNMSKVNYSNAVYMDRLNKRLGEARYINNEEDQGMWVRMRHDRIGKDNEFRIMNTMYELGYDEKQECDNGERRVGAAIDYMDGSSEYTGVGGSGDVSRKGIWLYDTWLGDKGHYSDFVAKWGHLSNDFTLYRGGDKITGDFSNNVYSISAEYGRKKDIGNNWYFEPQVQLQYARVTDANYTTSQGTEVSLDAINSLIARAGFRLGKDLGERSTVYFKADLLHEFLGDQDIYATDGTGTMDVTYGNEGTWYDVGFGFAAKMSKNSYAFMDFEKSFGNDNDETYQINAGMQWSF